MSGYGSKVKIANSRWGDYGPARGIYKDEPDMININISRETTDQLLRDILVQDYRSLKEDVSHLERRTLESHEVEDLINNKKYVEALEVLLTYYLPYTEATRIINEGNFNQDEEDEYEMSLYRDRLRSGMTPK